jgi:pyruvate/2-oxoglutarate dehydrogenase complex dihydrolipoamide acyltransferase (E2) component
LTDIQIPKLAMSMTEGQLTEWLVEDGASVAKNDPIYVIEADKSTQEIEAPVSGTIRILAQAGEIYEVGALVARIE